MHNTHTPPEIFSERRKQAKQGRAFDRGMKSFIWDYLAEEVADRLRDIKREFKDVLVIGPLAEYSSTLVANHQANLTKATTNQMLASHLDYTIILENKLPFAKQSFDLVISAGLLDSENDLPGALIQIRRCLRPDGLFLGSIFGEGNLARLKSALVMAEQDRASPHIHPQIDIKSAADLLSRAGFALPVADKDILKVRYSSLSRLIADIRDMGSGNALAGSRPYFGKAALRSLTEHWNNSSDEDGKVEEQFGFIHLSGWAPSEEQPKPARRGSATVSLASVLKPK
jgi:SAM-dependent methyltransferase